MPEEDLEKRVEELEAELATVRESYGRVVGLYKTSLRKFSGALEDVRMHEAALFPKKKEAE